MYVNCYTSNQCAKSMCQINAMQYKVINLDIGKQLKHLFILLFFYFLWIQ